MGKTQLALSLASELTLELKGTYFLKVGTVNALRDVSDRNLMAQNIPILFDEVTVGRMRARGPV